MWRLKVITSEKVLIYKALLLLGLISLVTIQRLTFLLFTVSDVITLIFSIMLNISCDDSCSQSKFRSKMYWDRFVTIEDIIE